MTGEEVVKLELFDDADRKVSEMEMVVVKLFGAESDDVGRADGSKQLSKDQFDKEVKAGGGIPPLYNPMVWAALMEQSVRLKRLIHSMAINSVGLGWNPAPL